MPLAPVIVESFPGIDLRQDSGDSRGALVASHVELGDGVVRSRDGFVRYVNGTAGETVRFLHQRSNDNLISTGQYVMAIETGATGKFYIKDSGGTVTSVVHAGLATGRRATAVTVGTPTATLTYMTDAAAIGPIRKYDGAAFSAPAGLPAAAGVLTYMPTDSRLVVCDLNSKVSISDAGATDTFGANNFVQLAPGDGNNITGAAVFDNKTFIFKQDKFFVFYGNSIDATGNPVFNYRTVDTGVGLEMGNSYPGKGSAAGPNGVYFQGVDGIYVTTGGPPSKISHELDPFFTGGVSPTAAKVNPFWAYGYWSGITLDMLVFKQKLYVQTYYFSTSGGQAHWIMLVYDIATHAWSVWPDYAPVAGIAQSGGLMAWDNFLHVGVNADVLLQSPGVTTDDIAGVATAFTSQYRLPFENYGSPQRKRVREIIVEGYGIVSVQNSHDWGIVDAGATPITLGTRPALAVSRSRRAMRGRTFSLQFSTSSGAWQINRVQLNLADAQGGSELTA